MQQDLPPSMQRPPVNDSSLKPTASKQTRNGDERQQPLQQPLFTEETRRRLQRLRQLHFHPTNIPDSPDFGTNQYININEELKQQLKDIVSKFHAPIRYAFAYGSGVFKQAGYDEKVSYNGFQSGSPRLITDYVRVE